MSQNRQTITRAEYMLCWPQSMQPGEHRELAWITGTPERKDALRLAVRAIVSRRG